MSAAFTSDTAKGEANIRFLGCKDVSVFYEKKLVVFIREILSFVDFTGLDVSCAGSPLCRTSQM